MAATIEDPDLCRSDSDPAGNSLLRHCFCFGRRRPAAAGAGWREWVREAESENRWWTKGFTAIMKVREWSEIVAGPKWKTFIRRFNRSRSGGAAGGGRHGRFQYDPLSYSLNFDEGQNGSFEEEDEHDRFRDFSARFASINSGPSLPAKELPVYS